MEIIVEAEACAAEFGGEFIHLSAYCLVNDAGVDLRGGEFGVAEHLADWLDRHSVGVCYGRCEGVAGEVRGYAFLDAEWSCYLFEVEVVFGVAQHGE